jgi:SGNH hydrolase-like domain, acetyltransferase AlgX
MNDPRRIKRSVFSFIGNVVLVMVGMGIALGWLSVSGDVIELSQNYHLVRETNLKARDLSEAAGSHFLLVYMPSKEHVYMPYLNDAETLANVFTDVQELSLDDAKYLQFTNQKVVPGVSLQYMDDQANLMAEFAAEQNFNFINLTSYFQEEAGRGVELYYPFDTHWNQSGHNLAARIIAAYIQDMDTASSSQNPGH